MTKQKTYADKGKLSVVSYIFQPQNSPIREAFEKAADVTLETGYIVAKPVIEVCGDSFDKINAAIVILDEIAAALELTVPQDKLDSALSKLKR